MLALHKHAATRRGAIWTIKSSRCPVQHRVRTVQARAQSTDATNSFISQFRLAGSSEGPLAGLTLAVKDMYDIAGHKTGFGSPTWLATHPPAEHTAPAVAALLAAGATVIGKTHMDELAYSLNGENVHYGTPVNVAAPGRIPGGSSSGSAAAVAAGQAAIGLGSDTGGSVRVPASFCGLYGLRPTHGRISLQHARPLAASYDTCGWFTRDATLLQTVGHVLLSHPSSSSSSSSGGSSSSMFKPRWLVAKDAFSVAQPGTTQAIYNALSGDCFERVQALLSQPSEVDVAGSALAGEGLQQLADWVDVFRITQAYEVWQTHGAWVTKTQPTFGPGTAARFKMAAGISKQEFTAANAKRIFLKKHIENLLGSDGVLALPTAPGPAVRCSTPEGDLNEWRKGLLSLTCIAGLSGLPQVTLPLVQVDGLPVGCSLIGPAHSDEQLLELAVKLTNATMKNQQD